LRPKRAARLRACRIGLDAVTLFASLDRTGYPCPRNGHPCPRIDASASHVVAL
jgi:hypothetical protein